MSKPATKKAKPSVASTQKSVSNLKEDTVTPHEHYVCLVLENKNTNPNGDPNNNGAPRVVEGNIGVQSNVSINRKVRDHVLYRTDAFLTAAQEVGFSDEEIEERLNIYVNSNFTAADAQKEFAKNTVAFNNKYWDARVFGSTLVAQGARNPNRCGGPIALSHAFSLNPIVCENIPQTRAQGMSGTKKGDFAGESKPMLYGIYVSRLHIAWTNRQLMGVDQRDIDLYLKLLPQALQIPSSSRPGSELLQLFSLKKPLNMPISANTFVEMCQPKAKLDRSTPATSREDYDFETKESVDSILSKYFSQRKYKWEGEGFEVHDLNWKR